MLLVSFIIRIYYDAWSSECNIRNHIPLQLHYALYLCLPKYIMHSLYRCLHNCSMQIYVHICALPVYLIVNAHVYLTAYDTGNVSGTFHNALPTQKPHSKHSPQSPPHLHCAPALKSVTAQIPRYVMAFSTVFTDPFLTTQCTDHIDAAITLLTFRLQTTTELLSTQVYSIYTSKQHTVLAVWTLL